jgi:hypothetical protein
MNTGARYLIGLIIGLLVIVSAFFGWHWQMAEVRSAASSRVEAVLRSGQTQAATVNAQLKTENERLKAETAKLQKEQTGPHPTILLSSEDTADLQSHGLSDPVTALTADLFKRNDLIPFSGVLGGTMRSYPTLIGPRWVVASFNDGHIGGWAILKYAATNGQINWTLMDAAKN